MPINLDGLIFGQIMPDNSGPPSPFDTDLDGTATQEDEFVSVTNTNPTALDISGWQIWSDSTGGGAPDSPLDGLYHTFPPGTVLDPGDTLWVINQIDGTLPFAQEASEGGVESGPGGASTNLLSEGNSGPQSESIALVNPANGAYIVFNMSTSAPTIPGVTDNPAFTEIGVIDGSAVEADPAAGESYQYDAATDTYVYDDAFIPCFAQGTLVDTPNGAIVVEKLVAGDHVLTMDNGPQAILWIGSTTVDLTNAAKSMLRPIEFKPGSLGPALPALPLVVSPQHRLLMIDADGAEVLAPAIGLIERRFVRIKHGAKSVTYYHMLLDNHAVITANGVPTESFYPGETALAGLPVRDKLAVLAHLPRSQQPRKARPFLTVEQTRKAREVALRPARAVTGYRRLDETDRSATA